MQVTPSRCAIATIALYALSLPLQANESDYFSLNGSRPVVVVEPESSVVLIARRDRDVVQASAPLTFTTVEPDPVEIAMDDDDEWADVPAPGEAGVVEGGGHAGGAATTDKDLAGGASCCSGPTWIVGYDVLFLDRDEATALPLVTSNATGATLLSAADLGFNEQTGGRLNIGKMTAQHTIEFSWLQDDWSSSRTVNSFNNLNAVAGTADYFLADQITAGYRSELDSYELNHWKHGSRFDFLVGLRMVTVDEDFRMTSTEGGNTSNYSISTDNDLWGVQTGLRWSRCLTGCLGLTATGKVGGYWVDASQAVDFRDPNNAADVAYINGSDDFAVVGEIDVRLSWYVRPRVKLSAGYQLAWVEGIALAPEQFQNNRAAIAAVPAINMGGFGAHGFHAGGEFTY